MRDGCVLGDKHQAPSYEQMLIIAENKSRIQASNSVKFVVKLD